MSFFRVTDFGLKNVTKSEATYVCMAEYKRLEKRFAELEEQLKPSLYWDASDTLDSHDSIEELMHIKFEDGAKVGDEIEIQRGVILPNEIYVITKIDDDDYSCEYELKKVVYDHI